MEAQFAMRPQKASVSEPTWQGFVETARDGLHIFEACLSGTLPLCPGRPQDRSVIVSGNVFVYDEADTGIRRWTDGMSWSPSRILTNFLLYRQLDDHIPQGEKRRAKKERWGALGPSGPYPDPASSAAALTTSKNTQPSSCDLPSGQMEEGERRVHTRDRRLVGSLVDSFNFKKDGLLKKAMTITVNGLPYHLIAYYSINDTKFHLKTPRDDPYLKDLRIRNTLLNLPKFESSDIDDTGDEDWGQAKNARSLAFNDHQHGYDFSSLHPTSQINVRQVQAFRPFQSQGIDDSTCPLPTDPSSCPIYPSDAPTCYQRNCVCACHFQDQYYPQHWGHQSLQSGLIEQGLL